MIEKNLLDLFIEKSANKEESYDDDEIIDDLLTFWAAGSTHISRLCTILTYNLHENQDYLKEITNEIEKNRTKGQATIDSVNKLETLQLFIKETLRFNGPANSLFGREAQSDVMIGDVQVKKGTVVSLNFVLNNHNPKNFDEPWKFNPRRWDKSEIVPLASYAFMPFSSGPRTCVGQYLAQVEAKIIIRELLSRYTFQISKGYVHKMILKFNYEPLNDLLIDLELRAPLIVT